MNEYVGALIMSDNRTLLVQNAKQKIHGLWSLPAGQVEIGEELEEATIRETREETGYKIRIIRRLATYEYTNPEYQYHIFQAEIESGQLEFSSREIMSVDWFNCEEIKAIELRPSNSFISMLLSSLIE
ncbi:MAG: NUDIX hydrolase [bacterium]|nr:NUDIX hydrolase [bacterium]